METKMTSVKVARIDRLIEKEGWGEMVFKASIRADYSNGYYANYKIFFVLSGNSTEENNRKALKTALNEAIKRNSDTLPTTFSKSPVAFFNWVRSIEIETNKIINA